MINYLLQFLFGNSCGFYMLFLFISKGPKPKTIADFWTMIWQEDVCNIVCLTNLTEGTKVRVNLRDIKYKISFVLRTDLLINIYNGYIKKIP